MDTLVIICFSFLFGLLGLLAFLLLKVRNSPEPEEICSTNEETEQQPTTSKSSINNPNELRVGSKVIKSRNSKTPIKKVRQQTDNVDLNNDEELNNDNATPNTSTSMIESGAKIGKKKLQKLGKSLYTRMLITINPNFNIDLYKNEILMKFINDLRKINLI